MNRIRHLILVTGLSGGGRSTALQYLEDMGYYYLDHLPVDFLADLLPRLAGDPNRFGRLAVGLHVPGPEGVATFRRLCAGLNQVADRWDLVFCEASVDRLVGRYRENRRRHPLAQGLTVQEAVEREAGFFTDIRAMADVVIDTTNMSVPDLKERLTILFQEEERTALTVFLRSFGFKYGANTDADMILDGRFLANPYYDPALRPLSGLDQPVRDYLEQDGEALVFLERLEALCAYLFPRYRKEKKRYFTIDIGCTGGRHRSVFLVEGLARRLREEGVPVQVRHRDKDRDTQPKPVLAISEEDTGTA